MIGFYIRRTVVVNGLIIRICKVNLPTQSLKYRQLKQLYQCFCGYAQNSPKFIWLKPPRLKTSEQS